MSATPSSPEPGRQTPPFPLELRVYVRRASDIVRLAVSDNQDDMGLLAAAPIWAGYALEPPTSLAALPCLLPSRLRPLDLTGPE